MTPIMPGISKKGLCSLFIVISIIGRSISWMMTPGCQESYSHSYKSYKSYNLTNLTNIGRSISWMMTQVVRSLTVILTNLTSITI